MGINEMIAESNRIENIARPPTIQEVAEFERFLQLRTVTLPELVAFLAVYQPNAALRDKPGLDVRVRGYSPPKGGRQVVIQLQRLLGQMNNNQVTAWAGHIQYELLHPFTDGNGLSGRMLWYWQTARTHQDKLFEHGFLKGFYFQTLIKEQSLITHPRTK